MRGKREEGGLSDYFWTQGITETKNFFDISRRPQKTYKREKGGPGSEVGEEKGGYKLDLRW